MEIFEIPVEPKQFNGKIKIIYPKYIIRGKNFKKWRIIINNKSYKLTEEFQGIKNIRKKMKIKYLLYSNDIRQSKYKEIKNRTLINKIFHMSYEVGKYIYKKIIIFGKKFVRNNKDKLMIVHNGKIYPLTEYFYKEISEEKNLEIALCSKYIDNELLKKLIL